MDARKILKEHGLKHTPCRQAVIELLSRQRSPLSAEEIHGQTKSNLSTVYRTLDCFTACGIAEKIAFGADNKYRYTLCHHNHKHYFHCTGCNSELAIDECPLNVFEQQLESRLGVKITEHNLHISGLCSNCMKNGEKNEVL